jgi:sorbose reductase
MSVLDLFKLEGKKAFVTGGATGIGKCAAMTFAEVGADVAIVDIDFERAVKTAKEISEKTNTNSIAIDCDVSNPDDVKKMSDTILKEYGTLDIAFNNAGIANSIPAEDITPEDFKKTMDVNLFGVFYTAQAAAKIMISQNKGGSIISTASMSAHIVNLPQTISDYCASKAAVMHMTKALAVEWARFNIRVNCVSPGYIATELVEFLKDMHQHWIPRIPMGRLGKPDDLKAGILYLASDASLYATGTDLVIDGGYISI